MDTTVQRTIIEATDKLPGGALSKVEGVTDLSELRPLLPDILEAAIRTLDDLPDRVHNEVHSGIVRYIKARKALNVVLNEQRIGNRLAARAKRMAKTEVRRLMPVLLNVKAQAQRGDDAMLHRALLAATANCTFCMTAWFSVNALGRRYRVYSKSFQSTVIPTAVVQRIVAILTTHSQARAYVTTIS